MNLNIVIIIIYIISCDYTEYSYYNKNNFNSFLFNFKESKNINIFLLKKEYCKFKFNTSFSIFSEKNILFYAKFSKNKKEYDFLKRANQYFETNKNMYSKDQGYNLFGKKIKIFDVDFDETNSRIKKIFIIDDLLLIIDVYDINFKNTQDLLQFIEAIITINENNVLIYWKLEPNNKNYIKNHYDY